MLSSPNKVSEQVLDVDQFYNDLTRADLKPLWAQTGMLTDEPRDRAIPFRWRATEMARLGERSRHLVPIDRGGDRRVLLCANPGLGGAPAATSTMAAGVQYLGGGESAPAHRHTPAALRFMLTGEDVWTRVDGDPIMMKRGDLVLTPSWTFHEHYNLGKVPAAWVDVIDVPLITHLAGIFYEDGPSDDVDTQTKPASWSEIQFAGGPGLVPTSSSAASTPTPYSPLFVYRWSDTTAALDAQLAAKGTEQAAIRYVDPTRGCDVMPTMRCEALRLRPASATRTDRQTGSRIGAVLNGSGVVVVGSDTFGLSAGDIYVVPSWATHRLESADQMDVFTTSDAPVFEALGVFRRVIVA